MKFFSSVPTRGLTPGLHNGRGEVGRAEVGVMEKEEAEEDEEEEDVEEDEERRATVGHGDAEARSLAFLSDTRKKSIVDQCRGGGEALRGRRIGKKEVKLLRLHSLKVLDLAANPGSRHLTAEQTSGCLKAAGRQSGQQPTGSRRRRWRSRRR